ENSEKGRSILLSFHHFLHSGTPYMHQIWGWIVSPLNASMIGDFLVMATSSNFNEKEAVIFLHICIC
ncbi:hypothetical protein MKX03_036121, partial [Papaver bracteatum]